MFEKIKNKLKLAKRSLKALATWYKYYNRIIGALLAGGGVGIIVEELFFGNGWNISGILEGYIFQHELIGLVMIIIGTYTTYKYKDIKKGWKNNKMRKI